MNKLIRDIMKGNHIAASVDTLNNILKVFNIIDLEINWIGGNQIYIKLKEGRLM